MEVFCAFVLGLVVGGQRSSTDVNLRFQIIHFCIENLVIIGSFKRFRAVQKHSQVQKVSLSPPFEPFEKKCMRGSES